MKKLILITLCALTLNASAQVADTIKKDLFTAPDTVKKLHSSTLALIPPAGLIVYGLLSFEVHPIRQFDYYVHSRIERSSPNFNTTAESYFLFAPGIAVYALNLVGVEGKNRFIDRTALLGLSGGILAVTGYSLKYATHRLRPNGADYLSFPSGHTSTAFMLAEFMAQEYSGKSVWYGVAAYTLATTTGVFRMYNRDHWFSDVVGGAGFGIMSTKLSYLVYPYLRNKLTHTDKTGRSTSIMPTYQNGTPGLSFAMQL